MLLRYASGGLAHRLRIAGGPELTDGPDRANDGAISA